LPDGRRPAVPRLAPAGPHARAVPTRRTGGGTTMGLHPGVPGSAGRRGRRVVPSRTRGLLPDGQSPRRHHRRVPPVGSPPRRVGAVLPVPALPLPLGTPAARGPRQSPSPHLFRGGAVPPPSRGLLHRRGADRG